MGRMNTIDISAGNYSLRLSVFARILSETQSGFTRIG